MGTLYLPRDLLALKVAQDLYFFLGNRLELRARILAAGARIRARDSG
jgi:hypothetical protein